MALLTKGATLKLDSTLVTGVKSMGEISESVSMFCIRSTMNLIIYIVAPCISLCI